MPDPGVPMKFDFQLPSSPGGDFPPISGGTLDETAGPGTEESGSAASYVKAYAWEVS